MTPNGHPPPQFTAARNANRPYNRYNSTNGPKPCPAPLQLIARPLKPKSV